MPFHSESVAFFVVLLLAAIVVGVISQRVRLPYTVSLILVGILLKALQVTPPVELSHELLMVVFLPALVFESAIHFPANELRQYSPTILTLALPGVLFTAVVTAIVLQFEFSTFGVKQPLTFVHFLLFGTIIAATDPVSVITLLRQLGIERRVSLIIEGESLFNDGTAIVLYAVVLSAISTGVFSFSTTAIQFLVVGFGGIAIGIACGLLSSVVISFMDDYLFCTALTAVTAYGSYLLAEHFGASGILATVVAGLFVGNIGKRRIMSPEMRTSVASFWEFIAFFLTSVLFLLMGLKVNLAILIAHGHFVLLAFFAVLASRAVTVFLPIPLLKRMGQPVNAATGVVIWWAGLRGSLAMVLALSLPVEMPARDTIIAMTFGVVVLSVVVQGITMGPILRMLKFARK